MTSNFATLAEICSLDYGVNNQEEIFGNTDILSSMYKTILGLSISEVILKG
jgi:hypothetical protein